MDTHFASPGRADPETLARDVARTCVSPVVSGLLTAAGGLLAVLNEHRQILVVNDTFLDSLGLRDGRAVLGLRPGEALDCVHAHDMPAGCGTSRYCQTCGAAVAIVATAATGKPAERRCVVTVERAGETSELCLNVRSTVITIEGRRLILLLLQDITAAERRAEVERMFFHDISNLVAPLVGRCDMLATETDGPVHEEVVALTKLARRLASEFVAQKALARGDTSTLPVNPQPLTAPVVLRELERTFGSHPATEGRRLLVQAHPPECAFSSDLSLLVRVLSNMVTNALEATPPGGEVRVTARQDGDTLTFSVWNREHIPDAIARRIFQRHFSTKDEMGRGLGTFAMRLFGERILGGRVDFATSEEDGTTFRLHMPIGR